MDLSFVKLALLAFGAVLFSFGWHYLFYHALQRAGFSKKIVTIGVAINFLFNLLYLYLRITQSSYEILVLLSSLSLGVTFVMMVYLLLYWVGVVPLSRVTADKRRRRFLQKSAHTALLGASSVYLAGATIQGAKRPTLNTVVCDAFDFTIVHISDLHIAGLIDAEFVADAAKRINALKPDIVCITGDLIDMKVSQALPALRALEAIKAHYGVYYVVGNHEYYHDLEGIITYFRTRSHITLLLNESVTIDALKLNIIGLSDYVGFRFDRYAPDIQNAFCGIEGSYETLVLAHQPRMVELIAPYRPRMILSGHTHGGQIFPFGYLVRLQQPFIKGLYPLEWGGYIYVNSGIGFWGPPMRLGSFAEIAHIVPKADRSPF